ncbi:MAG: PAS domain S-box protein [Bdellovibrionales bacterium]|nr:PAS domain S-box protein [Bdellovibrionales bacterium]
MSKVNLKDFFNLTNELLCIANAEGYFVEVNPSWVPVTGYSVKELKSKPFIEFVHPDDKEKTVAEAARLHNGATTVKFQNRYLCKDDSVLWLNWNAHVVDGNIYAVATDVTNLQEQKFFFNQMQESASIGYWKLDLKTMKPYWSEKTYDIHGRPRGEEVDLQNAINFYKPAYRPVIENAVNHAIETGEGWDLECEFVNAQGKEMWVRTIGETSQLNGKVVEVYGIFQDITEKKELDLMLETSLKESLRYKKAVDSQAIVVVTDAKGTITYVNERFCEISGYSQFELMGKNHRMVNSGYHPKEFWKHMWSTIKSGQQWQGLVKNQAKDGSYYWVDTSITPIKNKADKIEEFMAIRFDVTERVLLEEKVQSQANNLIRSSRLASLGEMAGGVAHEINNPLAIITAALAILQKPLENETVPSKLIKPTIDTIAKTSHRISKIVEGLRSFSRETDENETKVISLQDMIKQTLAFCSEKFRSHGVDIVLEASEEIIVDVNPQQIEQVLLNLLNNAFYAVQEQPKKTITIKQELSGDIARLTVADSGTGIPDDVAEKIFQPFFTTKPVGAGTGLGLGISFGIAQRHGGRLYLDQTAELTTFVLELKTVSTAKTQESSGKQVA